MKLEIKHLAPYTPYGVRVILETTERDLTAISLDSPYCFVTAHKGSREKQMVGIDIVKPILRPLSDLHSEFIIGDIYPFNSLSKRSRKDLEENNGNPLIMKYSYEDIQILLEHHFDIFGLIEKGLAIDINSLPLADA